MTFRLPFFAAAFAALPGGAFAHPGHIAAQGHGHTHLIAYLLLGGAVVGAALWARARRAGRAKAALR